eukprot:g53695.t1
MSNAYQSSIKIIPKLHENNFKTSLDMAADPTPQGAIYPLGDGVGVATFQKGVQKSFSGGVFTPPNSFILSPNECLTVEWVKPLVEQKVAKPAPYLPTPSISPPTSSSSSSSAIHQPARSVTSTLPSSVPVSARKMTTEEEEEWKDLPWHWDGENRVRVVTEGDGAIPEISECKRFLKALIQGAEGLQVRGSLVTKADGEVDKLYCDPFTALEECIVTYATKHKNQFARGIVASFPFIPEWMRETSFALSGSTASADANLSELSHAPSTSSTSSQPSRSHSQSSEPERSDCVIMMMENEEGLVEYDIVGWNWLDETQVVLIEAPTADKQAVAKVERSHQTNGDTARKRNSVVHDAATRKRNTERADWLLVLVDAEAWHTVAEGVVDRKHLCIVGNHQERKLHKLGVTDPATTPMFSGLAGKVSSPNNLAFEDAVYARGLLYLVEDLQPKLSLS